MNKVLLNQMCLAVLSGFSQVSLTSVYCSHKLELKCLPGYPGWPGNRHYMANFDPDLPGSRHHDAGIPAGRAEIFPCNSKVDI